MARKSRAAALKAADSLGSITGCLLLSGADVRGRVGTGTGAGTGGRPGRQAGGLPGTPTSRPRGEQAGRQAGGQAGRQAGGQAGRQAAAASHLAMRSQMLGPPLLGTCFQVATQLCRRRGPRGSQAGRPLGSVLQQWRAARLWELPCPASSSPLSLTTTGHLALVQHSKRCPHPPAAGRRM